MPAPTALGAPVALALALAGRTACLAELAPLELAPRTLLRYLASLRKLGLISATRGLGGYATYTGIPLAEMAARLALPLSGSEVPQSGRRGKPSNCGDSGPPSPPRLP
jgi:hypothetical protein